MSSLALLLTVLVGLFAWGAFAGIQKHPYGLLFRRLIAPRLAAGAHDEAVATDITKSVNHHFKREGRLMIWFVIGVPVILLICALVFGPALLTLAGR